MLKDGVQKIYYDTHRMGGGFSPGGVRSHGRAGEYNEYGDIFASRARYAAQVNATFCTLYVLRKVAKVLVGPFSYDPMESVVRTTYYVTFSAKGTNQHFPLDHK